MHAMHAYSVFPSYKKPLSCVFRKAKQVAGKVPSKLISDGASNFAEAHKDEYAPRNFLWKDSVHESHIRMDGDPNNNHPCKSVVSV